MKKVKNLPKKKKKNFKQFVKDQYIWWLMLLPGVLITAVFKYGSMFGIALAFQKFSFAKGGFFGHIITPLLTIFLPTQKEKIGKFY